MFGVVIYNVHVLSEMITVWKPFFSTSAINSNFSVELLYFWYDAVTFAPVICLGTSDIYTCKFWVPDTFAPAVFLGTC